MLAVGGLSEMIRVFELAAVHHKILMPHSPNVGPNSMASLHIYSTVTNAVRTHEYSEEFPGPQEQVQKLFKEPVEIKNGVIKLPDRPGLGLELDYEYLETRIEQ